MSFYKKTIKVFGSDKNAIICVRDTNIFTKKKLKILQDLVWDLEEVKYVQKVQSIFTTSFIRNESSALTTSPMLNDLDNLKARLPNLLKKIKNDPFINERLINVNKNMLSIIIQVDNQKVGLKKVHNLIEKKLNKIKHHFQTLYQTGEPTVEHFSYQQMINSQKIYIPLIGIILFICFYYFIKSVQAFFVTLIVTSISTLWTFSLIPFLGIPIQLMTSIVPGIVLTLSATEIIHIFASYNHSNAKMSKTKRLLFVANDVGLATTLTFTTTALGFLTIYLNDVQILKEFAIASSMNLIFAFIITTLYFPIHINIFSTNKIITNNQFNDYFNKINRFIYKSYLHFIKNKTSLLLIILFIILNIYYSSKVIVDNDAYEMIRNRTDVKKKITHFKDSFGGTRTFFAIIESKSSFKNKSNLERLWNTHQSLKENSSISHIESFAGLITLLNREMNGGDDNFYITPKSNNLIEQYVLTLSKDDLESYITSDYLKTNIKISHDVSSTQNTENLLKQIKQTLREDLPKDLFDITITSKNFLNLTASRSFIEKQTSSLITISILITVILGAYFKSFKIGLLSLIPNIFPIVGLFGAMGLLSIPLNIGTCIVAAVTIGIAADDTIHLFTRFFKEYDKNTHILWACRRTIKYEVIPIITTSLSLSLSFLVFSTSDFVPLIQFGLLSSYVLMLAIFSDLYIAPLLLTYFAKRDI
jgi:predicted RND superfamily exporter protein